MAERLPIDGADNNVWGPILNNYLLVSHLATGENALNWMQVDSGVAGHSLWVTDAANEAFTDTGVTYTPEFALASLILTDGSPGYSRSDIGTDTSQLTWSFAVTNSIAHDLFTIDVAATIISVTTGDREYLPVNVTVAGPGFGDSITVTAFCRTSLLGGTLLTCQIVSGSAGMSADF